MPHYKDGTPAEVGDFVKGKPYNTDHEIVGTMVQIAVDADSCKCIVSFVEPKVTGLPLQDFYAAGLPVPTYLRRVVGGRTSMQSTALDYENVLIVPKLDYGGVSDFIKVG